MSTQQEVTSWTKWVSDFDNSVKLFNDNYAGLIAQKPFLEKNYPDLMPEYNRLVNEANKQKTVIQSLKATRDKITGWIKSINPSQVFQDVTGYVRNIFGLGDMGALPLIPVAIGVGTATAAVAAIVKWTKDAYQFATKVNELRRLEAQGLTPQQASQIVSKTFGSSGTSLFGIDIKWLVIGGIALITLPVLFRALEKR